jgi:hypothetical protein
MLGNPNLQAAVSKKTSAKNMAIMMKNNSHVFKK